MIIIKIIKEFIEKRLFILNNIDEESRFVNKK